ncbi:MAG: hypothetical protein HY661_22720 [Betaproteobacteria bacterium]|nr:hypothetical protein [Betaproteobacteria bacterium]
MTVLLITTLSILAIAALAWAANSVLRVRMCPICLGVGGTWLWVVVARSLGFAVDASMLPILLGGSVAGLAYQLEKHLPRGRSSLLWKTLFIPMGFIAAYGLALPDWIVFWAATVALLLLTAIFFLLPQVQTKDSTAIEKLEQQMKKCC